MDKEEHARAVSEVERSGAERSSGPSEDAAAAETAAAWAAQRAGVTVRNLDELAELRQVPELFDGIWGDPQVNVELLRVLSHTGNYLAGSVDRDGELVGASVGLFTAPPEVGLHSHITGVVAAARGRSIGFALKLHQRAWALARGVREVTWTFDPLIRRNAYFNLVKLGARPREYLVHFYGEIDDVVNRGQDSDRLHAAWELAAPYVVGACAGSAEPADLAALVRAGAVAALTESATGGPQRAGEAERRPARVQLVQTPADIERLRAADSELARQWRIAVREVLGDLLAQGARVTGFTREGWYVVERADQ